MTNKNIYFVLISLQNKYLFSNDKSHWSLVLSYKMLIINQIDNFLHIFGQLKVLKWPVFLINYVTFCHILWQNNFYAEMKQVLSTKTIQICY